MSGRRRIHRVETVVPASLSAGQRRRLEARLHELWSGLFMGPSRDDFVRTHLFDDTTVVMGLGPGGDLAGFVNINARVLAVGERRYQVLSAGFFTDLEYRGSGMLSLAAATQATLAAARHPRLPTFGVAIAINPISYHMAGELVPRFYPAPAIEAPRDVLPLLHELARVRNLQIDPDNPWVIRFPVRLSNAARLRESRAYARGSAWMSFFEQQAPDWAEGQAVPVCVPVDSRNFLGALRRVVHHRHLRGRA